MLELISHFGYLVEGVETGLEALARIDAKPPDLLLTDVGLPDVDGLEIARRVKSNPATAHVPVLVISGHFNTELSAGALRSMCADAFLAKPLDLSALEETLAQLLSALPGRGPLPARALPGSR